MNPHTVNTASLYEALAAEAELAVQTAAKLGMEDRLGDLIEARPLHKHREEVTQQISAAVAASTSSAKKNANTHASLY